MVYGVTMGDSSGIGPEIVLKAFHAGEIKQAMVVYGDLGVLERYNRDRVPLRTIAAPSQYLPGALNVIDQGLMCAADVTPGKLSRASGAAARAYVVSATRAALDGEIAAIVTLPMNKAATQLSDPAFVGHTELIGSLCSVRDVTIMLASDRLLITHVSTHLSLARAIQEVRKERVETILRLTVEAARKLKGSPRVAVAGLNPHAGEDGLFGREEIEEIRPAIEWAMGQGMPVEGPFPADTLFYMAVRRKRFDVVVAMYHDQGHIPLKLLDFEGGVNIALGLPIIRTSVDHGTAFDITDQGIASTKSFVRALEFAARLASL